MKKWKIACAALPSDFDFLPHRDVVVDGLGVQYGKVDGDAVAWRHPDAPCAVLQVGVIIWMTWRVDGALQSCEISAAKCWGSSKAQKCYLQYTKDFLHSHSPVNTTPVF